MVGEDVLCKLGKVHRGEMVKLRRANRKEGVEWGDIHVLENICI